ncbi:hypothetical protein Rhal01_03103 [Rubritalea halochordaticola]|uniref:HD/PDEase domain-containing protein n=2 Tax=Rubritalea halochordaticola TaxID=714537 RepID=A0ABP9V4G7_9BACT
MGFIDAIKRWRLAQKGMSSGKKRRTQERAVAGSIDRSLGVRILLYVIFIVTSAALVYQVPSERLIVGSTRSAVFVHIIMSLGLVTLFDMQHLHRVRNGRVSLVFGSILFHLCLIEFVSFMAFSNGKDPNYGVLLIPFAFAPLVNSVLLGRLSGMFTTYVVTLLGALIVPQAYLLQYMVISLISGITVVLMTKNVRRRGALLRAGFYAGVVVLILAVVFGMIQMPETTQLWRTFGIKAAIALGVSILMAMAVSGILPALESIFGVTTDISWLEMSDLNHKLLRQMQLEAPGTFHHSLIVASLAEAAAEQVGANATMCRVCSYFHDIGKLKKPTYFIENQGDENPHDNLTPTMSALVIIAHVKDGVDMAMKHKLNPAIVDVIREHHGDSLVYYFYHKAKELRKDGEEKVEKGLEKIEDIPEVEEENFRYPGPRPRTPESGIISLADCVESASRTLGKPTPARIQSLVDDIVMKRVNEGMLDDTGLTLRDIKKIRESFAKTLRSMLHSRIDYPKEEDAAADEEMRKAGRPAAKQKKVEAVEIDLDEPQPNPRRNPALERKKTKRVAKAS